MNVMETFKATSHYGFTHFDVPDFADVIAEGIEMVEKGCVTEQDFREFTFTTNAARLHTRNNPGLVQGYRCRASGCR